MGAVLPLENDNILQQRKNSSVCCIKAEKSFSINILYIKPELFIVTYTTVPGTA